MLVILISAPLVQFDYKTTFIRREDKLRKTLLFILMLLVLTSAHSAVADQLRLVSPCRLLDTRGGLGPVSGSNELSVRFRNPPTPGLGGEIGCSVPFMATGIVINTTVISPTGSGHLQAYAYSQWTPVATRLNFNSGQTISNEIIVQLAPQGSLFDVSFLPSATTHIVADLVAYLIMDLETLVGQATGVPGAGLLTITKLDGTQVTVFAPAALEPDWTTSGVTAIGKCTHLDGFWINSNTFLTHSLPVTVVGDCH